MGSYLYLIAATRNRMPEVIAHVARMVVFFDTWITTPAGVAVAEGRALGPDFQRAYRLWFWMGVAGFLGMFVILLMMVTKLYPHQLLVYLT